MASSFPEKWYKYSWSSVAENTQVKIVWDTTILIDKSVGSNRADIWLLYKSSHEWILIDVPWDKNIVKARQSKIQSYQYMTGQIREIYQAATEVGPFVVGALFLEIYLLCKTPLGVCRWQCCLEQPMGWGKCCICRRASSYKRIWHQIMTIIINKNRNKERYKANIEIIRHFDTIQTRIELAKKYFKSCARDRETQKFL